MKNKIFLLIYCLIFSLLCSAQIPAGYYYLADGKKKDVLKSYLSTIISQAQMLGYGSGAGKTWQGFYFTDRNSDNSVVDMYSPIVRYFPENFGSVSGMHIEHSLPKSWWGTRENNAYKDLFHLYPADGPTNSSKNNLPLGEVSTSTFDNGMSKTGMNCFSYYVGRVFEPDDEFKGDFARSYFYMSTAYSEFGDNLHNYWNSPMINNNTYPVWQKWAVDLLLKWHRQDPVSPKETARQEQVFQIQGNRNPFIDYPELVEYIWGTDTNNVFHFPAETQPFMIQPNRWTKTDFGVIMLGNNTSKQMQIWGRNISGNVTLSIKNLSPSLHLSTLTSGETHTMQLTANQVNSATNIFVDISAQSAGSILDTLVISGGGLANEIFVPISVIISPQFMALKATETTSTTASLSWMNISNANSYTIRLFKSTAKSSDLFFSGYIEGSGNNKALVLYNNTGQSVDLSNFSIKKQTNGTGGFKTEYQLSGNLANGQKYVIRNNNATAQTLIDEADVIVYSIDNQDIIANFNGNDALGLYHNGVLIDLIGFENEISMWGENITLQRKSSVIHPTNIFSFDEWNILPTDNFSPAVSHSVSTFSDEFFNEYSSGYNNFITISNLSPQTQYIYEVVANITGGNLTTANRVLFATKPLETPLALDATDVNETSFTANWEEIEGAQGYRLDVYQTGEGAVLTETEGFDDLSGASYPAGWSGNTGAYYTSTAYIGEHSPAVAFSADARWLQTKVYSAPVTELSFMYRFGTASQTSELIIWGNKGGEEWFAIDTIIQENIDKNTAEYFFEATENFTSFKFVFKKNGSNMSLDDVFVKYGVSDTTYIVQNQIVNTTSYWVNNLTLDQTYLYRVKSYYMAISSDFSNEISVTTCIPPPILEKPVINNITENGVITFAPEDPNAVGFKVLIKNTSSDIIFQQDISGSGATINFQQNGTYYVSVVAIGNEQFLSNTSDIYIWTVGTGIDDVFAQNIIVYSIPTGIFVNNINAGDKISVFTPTGILLYTTTAVSDQIFIPISQNGIFIVNINGKAIKIMK
ncbi:MAG: endonuclease [Prevotellaceae bacterium]|jgi:hypothetical protein|nr:endonuclease [Prevotellaceae bacterium]